MRALRILVLATACGCVLGLPAIAASAQPTVVSLEFDHAFSDALQGVALAQSHGMPVTLFAMSGRVGLPGYMTYPQLLALQAQGDEIGGHTIDHPDLSTLTPAARRAEICGDRTALQQAGLDVTDFAYPFGYFDAATPGIVRGCGYESAREAGGLRSQGGCDGACPAAETIAPRRVYDTRTAGSILDTTSLATIEGYVEHAQRAGGGWLQIVFHHVCDRCDTYAVSEPTLASFVSWLAAREPSGVHVETVRQVIETPFRPGPVRVRVDTGGGRLLRAAVRCPKAPGTAGCVTVPGGSSGVVVAGLGSTLTVLAPAGASAVRLALGRGGSERGRRARLVRPLRHERAGDGGRLWRIRLPERFSAQAATVTVTFPLGTSQYRLELVPTPPPRR